MRLGKKMDREDIQGWKWMVEEQKAISEEYRRLYLEMKDSLQKLEKKYEDLYAILNKNQFYPVKSEFVPEERW